MRKREPREHWGKAVPRSGNESVEALRSRRVRMVRAGHVENMGTARSLRALLLEVVMRPRSANSVLLRLQ